MVDVVIVCVYLVLVIIIGYIYGRHTKDMRDFAVANKTFSTTAVVSTIFATWMGGDDLIGVSERIYSVGLIFLIVNWTQFISLLIHAYVIAPKILEDFEDKVSIGEIMGELYGDVGKVMTGVASILVSIGYISIQISCLGYACSLLPGVSHFWGTVIGSVVVITYASFGGIRAVVSTDALQFGILIVAIPIMAHVALYNIGGLTALIDKIPDFYLSIGPSRKDFMYHVALSIACAFPFFSPLLIQRILISKNVRQATQSLTIAGSLFIPFYIAVTIIALYALVAFPNIDPNSAFLNVLTFSLPPIIKGFAIVGFLAVVMSTSDSHINIASVSVTRDIAVVIWPKLTGEKQLLIARIMTVVIGFFSIFIATSFYSMIDFWIYFSNFWMPVVTAPMVLYMFSIKVSVKYYVISTIIGLLSIVLFRSYGGEEVIVMSQILGMSVSIASMMIFYKTASQRENFVSIKKKRKYVVYGD